MKRNLLIVILSIFISCLVSRADNNVLQIFESAGYFPESWENIDHIEFDTEAGEMLLVTKDNNIRKIDLQSFGTVFSGRTVPYLKITTENYMTEIQSKEVYEKGSLSMEGLGIFDDVSGSLQIKGRGNTSWAPPKKPYRLKFDKKINICGLPKSKSYVLLANWQDPSFMHNAVAAKLSNILEMPYNNPMVPVEVEFNGIYKGAYSITNKVGINAGSVDIDENKSILWELDTNYDEDYKFYSPIYNLPVMVSDPDFLELTNGDEEEAERLFESWKVDFIEMEQAVQEGRAFEYVDLDMFARYLLVYDITKNDELQHPKSVKLYKTGEENSKYMFGPVWDFDGAWSLWTSGAYYSYDLINERVARHEFFKQLEKYEEVREAYKFYFQVVKDNLPELLDYIDEYADLFRTSCIRDAQIWWRPMPIDDAVKRMKEWLLARLNAMEKFEILLDGV